MYYVFLILFSVFAAYGIVSLAHSIYKHFLHCCIDDKLIIVTLKKEDAESAVRCIMRENPDSEVVVINKAPDSDAQAVLSKLEHDFSNIHII